MEINGKPVVDSTTPLVLEILAEDCTAGKNKDPGGCAAARAIMRSYKVLSARVHVGVSYVEESKRWIRYLTPASLRNEIVAFDRGGSFEPGAYRLSPPGPASTIEAVKRHNINRSYDKRTRHDKNKTKTVRHVTTNIRPRGANR